jgi:hypothetical protein
VSRQASTTRLPARASSVAAARPSPLFAPVTTAVRPFWRGTSRVVHFSAIGPYGNVRRIGCLVALFALISPRLALFLIWIFEDWLSRAFDSWIVPVLGFFLLPWTTLAYTVMWVAGSNGVNGFEWFLVVLGFFFDLASHAESQRARFGR